MCVYIAYTDVESTFSHFLFFVISGVHTLESSIKKKVLSYCKK